MSESGVPARDASTVMLVRDGEAGIEVFLQRRVKAMAVAAGVPVVPGGGVAFLNALPALDKLELENADEMTGVRILRRALEEPLRRIAANAGQDGSVIVQKVRSLKRGQGCGVWDRNGSGHGFPGATSGPDALSGRPSSFNAT